MKCVFCQIVKGTAPARIRVATPDVLIFDPIGPHAPGHVLVIPRIHVAHAVASPLIAGRVMEAAATYANRVGSCNILTSAGRPATQSVKHLHIHVIPRGADDGLPSRWPWIPEPEGDPS